MADSNLRSNPVNVEQIMEQIRGRIREQRGVEYTEQQLQELAAAQLEKFLDPRKVRSNLLEEFRRMRAAGFAADTAPAARDDAALFQTDNGLVRAIRVLLRPFTRLFVNTRALAAVLLQSQTEQSRRTRDQVLFELVHNLVVETARLNIELKNLKMKNDSLAGRVEFNERRVRTLEGNSTYQTTRADSAPERPFTPAPASSNPSVLHVEPQQERAHAPQPPGSPADASGQRRRRRRRRGRRGGGAQLPPGAAPTASPDRPVDSPYAEASSSESTADLAHEDTGDSDGDDGGSDIEPQ